MQEKLPLCLCVIVLFGALCAGNPFLPSKDAPAAPAWPSGGAIVRGDDAVESGSVPPGGRVVALASRGEAAGSRAAGSGALRELGGAAKALADASAAPVLTPAFTPVALHTSGPVEASSHSCPDPALRPLVVATERGLRGETVWVLGDGRRFVRNPRPAAGQPLLVLLVDDVK